jgi:putative transposase
MDGREVERLLAVERHRKGETIEAICCSMKKSRSWFYKWWNRFEEVGEEWYEERSRSRRNTAGWDEGTRRQILETRARLEAEGTFVGAQMIAWELEEQKVVVPSISTIKRVLKSAGLTTPKRRTPKGTNYPAPLAMEPGAVHQADFVGPRYVNRGRFYSLNVVDVCSGRAAAEPIHSRATEDVIPGLWNIWTRLGIPKTLQLDNELVFFGNRRYPNALGQVMRLCFSVGVEMLFIPIREPWRNSFVEKFNDHWNYKFYRRTKLEGFDPLRSESLLFESRHNSKWRYSKLQGRTPNAALAQSSVELRFPDRPTPPPMPLAAPARGRVSFIRLIRSDRQLEIFGQRLPMPPEATYEYVRATIDIAAQQLTVTLRDQLLATHPFPLERATASRSRQGAKGRASSASLRPSG